MILRHLYLTLIALTLCHGDRLHAGEAVPKLINEWGTAPNPFYTGESISGYHFTNDEKIEKIVQMDAETVRKAVKPRLKDKATPEPLKLLYAGILACFADRDGQTYLIQKAENAKTASEAADTFWVIGHLERFYPYELQEKNPVDMKWAETFMLEMLSKRKQFKDEREPGNVKERQIMAIDSDIGNFGRVLAKNKCPELFSILEALWKEDADWYIRRDIAWAFEDLGDKRAAPLLLQALDPKNDGLFRSSASALAAMQVNDAVPILLEHLDNFWTIELLEKFDDPRILPALKASQPTLKGYPLGDAKLYIILNEDGDRLAKLIELSKDPIFKIHNKPMREIAKLKDPRAIPFAHQMLHQSDSLSHKSIAIVILGEIEKNPKAIKSLIDALSIDFQSFAKDKNVIQDNNKLCRKLIADYLKKATGEDFGPDQKKWLEHFKKTHPDH